MLFRIRRLFETHCLRVKYEMPRRRNPWEQIPSQDSWLVLVCLELFNVVVGLQGNRLLAAAAAHLSVYKSRPRWNTVPLDLLVEV